MILTGMVIVYVIMMITLTVYELGNSYPITARGLIIQFCIWGFIYFAGYQAGQINYFDLNKPKEQHMNSEQTEEFFGDWKNVKTNQ